MREREREAAGIPKGNSDVNSYTGHQCLDTDLVQREEREPGRDHGPTGDGALGCTQDTRTLTTSRTSIDFIAPRKPTLGPKKLKGTEKRPFRPLLRVIKGLRVPLQIQLLQGLH
jgi:hypothetical protein